jgi:hypothetical protein
MLLFQTIKLVSYIDGLKIGNLSIERSPTPTDCPNRIFILDRSEVKNGVNHVFLVYKHCILRGMGCGLRVAGYGVQGFRGSEVQGFRGSGFRGSEVQGFRGSEVQGFRGSGVQGSGVQRFSPAAGHKNDWSNRKKKLH